MVVIGSCLYLSVISMTAVADTRTFVFIGVWKKTTGPTGGRISVRVRVRLVCALCRYWWAGGLFRYAEYSFN